MFNPFFKLADADLPAPVILFATFGGLRGAVSLILAQMLVTQQDQLQKSRDMLQTAQVCSQGKRLCLSAVPSTVPFTCAFRLCLSPVPFGYAFRLCLSPVLLS